MRRVSLVKLKSRVLEKLQEALEWATVAHNGQWRDGEVPLPYITHVMEVVMLLREVGGVTDEELLLAAACHDMVEHTDTTLEEIRQRFGDRAAALVKELTRKEPDASAIANLSKDQIWELRAKMLVAEISEMSPDAQQIKLADRISNLREAFRTKKGRKRKRYVGQTQQILQAVPRKTNPALWKGLERMVRKDGEGPRQARRAGPVPDAEPAT